MTNLLRRLFAPKFDTPRRTLEKLTLYRFKITILRTDFRDYDLGRTCAGYCDKDYEKCVDTCEFNKVNDCLMTCGRIFTICVESCPCHTDCIKGCEGCPNPICYCNVSFELLFRYFSGFKFFIGCLQR